MNVHITYSERYFVVEDVLKTCYVCDAHLPYKAMTLSTFRLSIQVQDHILSSRQLQILSMVASSKPILVSTSEGNLGLPELRLPDFGHCRLDKITSQTLGVFGRQSFKNGLDG